MKTVINLKKKITNFRRNLHSDNFTRVIKVLLYSKETDTLKLLDNEWGMAYIKDMMTDDKSADT